MFKKHKLGWPQVVLASVAIVTFAAVYLLVGAEDKDMIEKTVLAVWAFASTFLGPVLQKRLDDKSAAHGDGGDKP